MSECSLTASWAFMMILFVCIASCGGAVTILPCPSSSNDSVVVDGSRSNEFSFSSCAVDFINFTAAPGSSFYFSIRNCTVASGINVLGDHIAANSTLVIEDSRLFCGGLTASSCLTIVPPVVNLTLVLRDSSCVGSGVGLLIANDFNSSTFLMVGSRFVITPLAETQQAIGLELPPTVSHSTILVSGCEATIYSTQVTAPGSAPPNLRAAFVACSLTNGTIMTDSSISIHDNSIVSMSFTTTGNKYVYPVTFFGSAHSVIFSLVSLVATVFISGEFADSFNNAGLLALEDSIFSNVSIHLDQCSVNVVIDKVSNQRGRLELVLWRYRLPQPNVQRLSLVVVATSSVIVATNPGQSMMFVFFQCVTSRTSGSVTLFNVSLMLKQTPATFTQKRTETWGLGIVSINGKTPENNYYQDIFFVLVINVSGIVAKSTHALRKALFASWPTRLFRCSNASKIPLPLLGLRFCHSQETLPRESCS